jgi:hydrogen peroxide-dependent heme synthase
MSSPTARSTASPAADAGSGPVTPSTGWGVVHLMLRAAPGAPGAEGALAAIEAFAAVEPQQAIVFSVLGGRADVGLMALGPDLDALDRLVKAVLAGPFEPTDTFVSLTELSEYTSTEDDERARLEAEGADDVEARLVEWRARMDAYRDARLHPRLPPRAMIAFYPMSKRREPGANWYELGFDDRKRLMAGHAAVGRRYSGRILQLITGATGLDDWEWGVTLLADDPAAIKEIVYEMRFDEVSARYAEFGPFVVGLVMEPRAAFARAGVVEAP